ncbi:TraH family protein (plasmid) [Bradyrhizobium septentrionale]|uniref:TraH family protein n=1 Tax=Bradyrhizobium septentrionale TaxID=1404411 RepID=UPI0030D0827E
MLWGAASVCFVAVHAVLWSPRPGSQKAFCYLITAVLMAVPPFGIVGWAHPIRAAGVLFPGWGWWGLAATATGLLVMTTKAWPVAAIALADAWARLFGLPRGHRLQPLNRNSPMAVDADLVQKCADPTLKPAIVEKFLHAAGAPDPLAVMVRSGDRIILLPPVKTPEEALELARSHIGRAVVRVGITQYPAGLGVKDPSEMSPDLFDACKNIRAGTALFGKVWRIVWKWYGNPTDDSVMSQMFDDAVEAWTRGQFEGTAVFTAPDPGGPKPPEPKREEASQPAAAAPSPSPSPQEPAPGDPHKSGIRIDLSGIGGRAP